MQYGTKFNIIKHQHNKIIKTTVTLQAGDEANTREHILQLDEYLIQRESTPCSKAQNELLKTQQTKSFQASYEAKTDNRVARRVLWLCNAIVPNINITCSGTQSKKIIK